MHGMEAQRYLKPLFDAEQGYRSMVVGEYQLKHSTWNWIIMEPFFVKFNVSEARITARNKT